MKLSLRYTSIHELGQRKNQEDSLYPDSEGIIDNPLFIVCDGMGGHEHGEVASEVVCKSMSEYIKEHHKPETPFTDEIFNDALSAAYDSLDLHDNGAERKMGTTMAFLYFHRNGCFAAHIGDSRIYHIRPSAPEGDRILYVSRDHSLVNDLLAVGELKKDEISGFAYKNVITRSMQPGLERRPKAEIRRIDDIRSGDYFLLCSDGILEQMGDEELVRVISERGISDNDKTVQLIEHTAKSADNHTAHLIHVTKVTGGRHSYKRWKAVLMIFFTLAITFMFGMSLMRYRHKSRIERFIQRDVRQYEEIFHKIDSLEQISLEQPRLMDIYMLYLEASMLETKHEGMPSAHRFNRGAANAASKIKEEIELRKQ